MKGFHSYRSLKMGSIKYCGAAGLVKESFYLIEKLFHEITFGTPVTNFVLFLVLPKRVKYRREFPSAGSKLLNSHR